MDWNPVTVIDILNHNSGLITAVATAVVAIFSIGTWRLYKLERRRQQARRGRTAARISQLTQQIGAQASYLTEELEPPTDTEDIKLAMDWLRAQKDSWTTRAETVRAIYDSSFHLPPKVAAHLQAVLDTTVDVQGTLNEALRALTKQKTGEFMDALRRYADIMTGVRASLEAAYEAIPVEQRSWGGESKEYRQLAEDAKLFMMGEMQRPIKALSPSLRRDLSWKEESGLGEGDD